MKRIFPRVPVLAFWCLLLATAALAQTAAAPQTARRIRFARGAYSKTVAGTLDKQHPRRYFVARTRAGQRMSVKVTPRTRHAGVIPLVIVTSPSGVKSTEKSPRFDTQSTEAGDYLIRVDTNMMASNGDSGDFLLKVWIR